MTLLSLQGEYFFTLNHSLDILKSDGLWDVISYEECNALVHAKLEQNCELKSISKSLIEEAMNRGTMDNITICVLFLH